MFIAIGRGTASHFQAVQECHPQNPPGQLRRRVIQRLLHRQPRNQVALVRDVSASLLEESETHRLVVEEDLAARGALDAPGDDVQKGLLAAALRAEDGEHLARVDGQGDVLEDDAGLEAAREALEAGGGFDLEGGLRWVREFEERVGEYLDCVLC